MQRAAVVPTRAGQTLVEGECIGSPRQIDQDLIVNTFGCIIFSQLSTKPSCLDANCGINMRVEMTRAPKDLRSNLILLGSRSGVFQRMINQIAQQLAQGLGAVQSMTTEELFDLAPVMSLVSHFSHPWFAIVTPTVTLFAAH